MRKSSINVNIFPEQPHQIFNRAVREKLNKNLNKIIICSIFIQISFNFSAEADLNATDGVLQHLRLLRWCQPWVVIDDLKMKSCRNW